MMIALRWLRLGLSYCFAVVAFICAFNYQTSIYLIYQARGQLAVLLNTQPLQSFKAGNDLSQHERESLELVEQVKRFSVDSLGYKPTRNFTAIYDQRSATTLWVITACRPYAFSAYEWSFPIVGKVSYKGFFKKSLAQKEYNHLIAGGYDADMRSVSAWSTLGWFSDPVLSSMLQRSKGGLSNLLFHELFHATYYAPGKVDFNENIASFIAHKATLLFLKNDTAELSKYRRSYNDNIVFSNYMLRKTAYLETYYHEIKGAPGKYELKLRALYHIADSIQYLPLADKKRFMARKEDIMKFKNAYFIDFKQYDSMQDSLEMVFNKIYKGNLVKLVRDLKLN